MSTRGTVYYDDDLHIYTECFQDEGLLFMEYAKGPFILTTALSMRLSGIILAGIEAQRRAPEAAPSCAAQDPKGGSE